MSRRNRNNRRIMNICRYIIVVCLAAAAVLLTALLVKPNKKTSASAQENTGIAVTSAEAGSIQTESGQSDGSQAADSQAVSASTEGQSVVVDVETTEATTEDPNAAPTVSAVDVAQVGQIIDRYYEAKSDNDVDALNNIVDSDEEYKKADLEAEMQYITKYDNFRTYVLPGYTDNYFIVYVRYDIYFNGITTGAPSLNHFIVSKDDDGYYCIYNKSLSGEFQAYLEETEKSDTVVQLMEEVEEDLQKACDENEDLKYLMQMLTGSSDEETEAEKNDGDSAEANEETEETTAKN